MIQYVWAKYRKQITLSLILWISISVSIATFYAGVELAVRDTFPFLVALRNALIISGSALFAALAAVFFIFELTSE